MKKLITLLIVLICCVGTVGAANVTKRFYAVNQIANWDGWGSDIKIHIFYNNGTTDVGLTNWNVETMTKIATVATNQDLYYYDISIDENIVNNYDLSVIFIANNYSSHENDWHYRTYQETHRYTTDYVYYLWSENSGSSVGRSSEAVTYYLASWPTGDNPTRTFTALTGTDGVYSAEIAIPTEATYYCLAPSFALEYTGSTPTDIKWWDALYRRNASGDYWINNFQYYNDSMTFTSSNGIWYYPFESGLTTMSQFDFDIINMTFTVRPYFTRTPSATSTGYMTYSYGSNAALPEGVTAYFATGLSEGSVTLTAKTGSLKANAGYMLRGTAGTEYKFYATNVAPNVTDEEVSANLMKPSVSATNVVASTDGCYHYFFSSQPSVAFYRLEADATSAAGRAYLETTSTIGSSASGAKLNLIIGDDETTAIDNVKATTVDSNAPIYNIAGQRVANDYKGIVIQNGRKYVVK